MDNIINKLIPFIQDKKILVACSTGVDSTVLLDLVFKASKNKTQIVVVHINHGRRKASDIEEAYLKDFCQKNNLTFYSKKLPKTYTGNFQEWARKKRYKFFLEIAKLECVDIIMTAHHGDDNLETILMRIIKISSFKGYGGMEEISSFHGYMLYRPLLYLDKGQIIAYAKSQNLIYFEDSSNFEDDYLRNRIRKYVIPALKEENPSLMKAIEIYSETIFDAEAIIQDKVNSFIKEVVQVNNNISQLTINSLLSLNSFMQMQVLFELLKPYQLSRSNLCEIIKQIKATKSRIINLITPELLMIKEYGNLIFTKPIENNDFYLKIDQMGTYQLPNGIILEVSKNICNFKARNHGLCYNIQALPIIIRSRIRGDRIQLRNGSKTVSDYLTDKKIPYLKRQKVLLLCDENNKVLEILEPLSE